MYDMPLRDYDPAIGRWVVQDPVIHHSQSPYSSFNGNPVLFADPSGGRGQMLDRNGANMFDENGNYIWHADREVPGEVSMAAYGSGGSTVEKMINKINGLSDAKKATLPPPHVLLQMLIDEANAGGDWEGMLEEAVVQYSSDENFMCKQQPKSTEEKVRITLKKYKIGDKIDLKDFGRLVDSKLKTLISYVEKVSDTDFKIVRTFAGRFAIPEKAGFKIETNGVIKSGEKSLRGLKITTYGLPASEVEYTNGLIHRYNTFLIEGDDKIYLLNNKFYRYEPVKY